MWEKSYDINLLQKGKYKWNYNKIFKIEHTFQEKGIFLNSREVKYQKQP